MIKSITSSGLLLLLLTCSSTALAQGRTGSPVVITVQGGELNPYGRRADVQVEFLSSSPVTLRIIALSLTYDTITRTSVQLSSPPEFQLLIEPQQARTQRITMVTDVSQGEIIDWPRPQRIDVAVGADVEAMAEVAGQVSNDPDEILAVLQSVDRLSQALRAARTHYPEVVDRLPDPDAWFDWEAVLGLRPNLEAALCAGLGRRISQQRNARTRVEAYQAAAVTLLSHDLYPECLPSDVRLLVARALIDTNRAQDALVLTDRDEQGEVRDEWRDIYVTGRLALASDIANFTTARQYWPALESLNEVARLDPENRELPPVADRLLRAVADQVEFLLRNESEAEAIQLIGLMRERWSTHPQVQRASRAMAEGLLRYANRSLARDNLVGAGNAYVMGIQNLQGVPEWEAILPQIQEARRNHFVQKAESFLSAGNLDAAEEALEDAEQLAAVDPDTHERLTNAVLQARWANLDRLIEQERFEDVMNGARQLEQRATSLDVFGEARARTYLSLASAIWDKYGIFVGLANRTRIDLAEEALELGSSADPARAEAIRTKLLVARWIFPGVFLVLVVIGGVVMIVRADWRKRLKARGLWRRGLKLAAQGRLANATTLMEKAYNLTAFDDRAPAYLGEESRGHLILQIAALHSQRERDDQVEIWSGEWLAVPELERPISIDFKQALSAFTAGPTPRDGDQAKTPETSDGTSAPQSGGLTESAQASGEIGDGRPEGSTGEIPPSETTGDSRETR